MEPASLSKGKKKAEYTFNSNFDVDTMKEPNLFIIGAPKCGTTSVFNALAQHPQVVAPELKEPHFYSTDFYRPSRPSREQYLALFDDSLDKDAIYVMDGSTRYIYSDVALQIIAEEVQNAKVIVCLRNPVDMLYSLHNHLVFLGIEREKSFSKAWRASLNFDRQRHLEEGCPDPDSLNYPKMGLLGERLLSVKSRFTSKQLMVVIYEDIVDTPGSVMMDLIDFLGLHPCEVVKIGHNNRSMARKSELLFCLTKYGATIKRYLGINYGFGFLNYLARKNRIDAARPPLPAWLREEISNYFSDDISVLESALGRKLNWSG